MNSLLGFIQLGKWEFGKPVAAASGGAVTESVSDALSFSDSVTLNLLQTSDTLTLSDSASYTLAIAGINFAVVQSAQSIRDATSLAFPNPVTVGDLLIVVLGVAGSSLANPPSISDTLGNIWSQGIFYSFGVQGISVLYAVANATGADTISVTGSGFGSNDSQILLAELSGNITNEIDVAAGNTAASGSSADPILTLTQPGDVVVSAVFGYGGRTAAVTPPEILIQAITKIDYRYSSGLAVTGVAAAGSFQSSLDAGTFWASQQVLYVSVAFFSTLKVKPLSDTLVLSDAVADTVTITVAGVTKLISDSLSFSDALASIGGATNNLLLSDTLTFLDFAYAVNTVLISGTPITCLTGSDTSGSAIPNFVY